MLKGRVISIEEDYILVLSKDMKYLKLRKKNNVLEGKEIFFFQEDIMKEKISCKYFSLGLVAAIFLLFINVFINNQTPKNIISLNSDIAAVISIDINPSLEIEVDKDLKVVGLKSYNYEGSGLLNLEMIKGKYITLAMKDILYSAKNKHYLNETSNSVLLAIAPTQKDLKENIEELKKQINTMIQEEGENLKYIYMDVDKKVLDDARKLDISIGKLSIYKKNKNAATLEKVKSLKVVDMLNSGLINDDNVKVIKTEKSNSDNTNTKTEMNNTFVINSGNEFININALEFLNIETSINLKTKEISVKNQAKNEILILNTDQDLIVKNNMYFVSMKSIFDEFSYKYDYIGSNIHINKDVKEITVKYFGTGELVEKTDATVPKEIVPMKGDQSNNKQSEKNTPKIKYAEISDINNKEPIVLVTGNELINEEILTKLNLEYRIDYNTGTVIFKNKASEKNYSLDIENTIFKINDNIYFIMKDVLDLFHYKYRYVDKGIFIDTNDIKMTLQGIRTINADINKFKIQINSKPNQEHINEIKPNKEDIILIKHGNEYLPITILKEFDIKTDTSMNDKEIVFSKGDKIFSFNRSDISISISDNIIYVLMKDILDLFGVKYEIKKEYVNIGNKLTIKTQNISK